MPVVLLPEPTIDHASTEEGDAVNVAEDDAESSVEAEEFHHPELGDGAYTKRQHICKHKTNMVCNVVSGRCVFPQHPHQEG